MVFAWNPGSPLRASPWNNEVALSKRQGQSDRAAVGSLIDTTNAACADRLTKFLGESGGEAAYFIGSGLSRPFYPGWSDFVLQMQAFFQAHDCDVPGGPFPTAAVLEKFLPADLHAVFQRFRDANGQLYVECIRDVFDCRPPNHNACTVKILRRYPPLIVTLNYDIAIESAAEDCGVKFSRRFFPGLRHLNQTHKDRPVIMHLHGTFYDGLFSDPDEIILHSASYRRYYEEGHREILSVYADIFSRWPVVFVGTRLSEPEMAFFFKALHAHQADADCEKRRIALLDTSANSDDEAAAESILRAEQSKDLTDQQTTGIERVRFFKKDDNFFGLNEILSKAFGQNITAPKLDRIW